MIIAVDFDGTLCRECYPEVGAPDMKLINFLINRRVLGDKLILWTCREDKPLEDALKWCRQHGLEFDAVNDNLLKLSQGQTGIFAVVMCATLLEIRLNNAFVFQVWFIKALHNIKELFNNAF